MKTFLIALALAACGAASAEPVSFQAAAAREINAASPARYSFVDLYRLTVSGAPVAEPHFSIASRRQPEPWLLALAGLALAGWVAHRRLAHAV